MIHALTVAVKRQQTPLTRALYQLAKTVRRFDVPAPKLIFRPLYYGYTGTKSAVQYVASKFFYQPMFRARCESCGPGLELHLAVPYLYGDLRLIIGQSCKINGRSAFAGGSLFDAPTLKIGDHTNIGFGCVISVSRAVTLGSHVRLADGCTIADNPGHPLDPELRRAGRPCLRADVKPVVIEDDVWLGGGVRVLPGVTIGHGSVVGAGSVVTRDIPPMSLAVGSPARIVRTLGPEAHRAKFLAALAEVEGDPV